MSPILATIILLAIVLVGGALLYGVFTNYLRINSATDQVTVESAQLTVAVAPGNETTNSGILSLSVKNTATSAVTGLCLTLYDPTGGPITMPGSSCSNPQSVSFPIQLVGGDQVPISQANPLDTGQTASGLWVISFSFVSQYSYAYTVSATFQDSSTYSTSGTVVATG